MTGGFLGVVTLVASPFLIVDLLWSMIAVPPAIRYLTVPEVPIQLRAEFVGLAALPIGGLLLILLGGAVSAARFRNGDETRRWLAPLAPATLAHAGAWVLLYLAQ